MVAPPSCPSQLGSCSGVRGTFQRPRQNDPYPVCKDEKVKPLSSANQELTPDTILGELITSLQSLNVPFRLQHFL